MPKLLEKICQKLSDKNEKEFYFLDIGAGNFQCGRAVATYINENRGLFPNLKKAHIISVRAERNTQNPIQEDGICKLYNYGAFKVEELEEEFLRNPLLAPLGEAGKIDLIVSSWCFRHLVDPAGTFVQAYNLLRPGSGTLLMDGFFLNIDKVSFKENNLQNLVRIIHFPGAEAILDVDDIAGRRAHSCVIRRYGIEKCSLPLSYDSLEEHQSDLVASGCVTKFKSIATFVKKNDFLFEKIGSYFVLSNICSMEFYNSFLDVLDVMMMNARPCEEQSETEAEVKQTFEKAQLSDSQSVTEKLQTIINKFEQPSFSDSETSEEDTGSVFFQFIRIPQNDSEYEPGLKEPRFRSIDQYLMLP